MTGKAIAHYEIVAKLGEGGMGVVWKARDTHLDRFVALKMLYAADAIRPDRLRRFVQEAKAASALNHPNIVHIYDIAEWQGSPYIAMQYAPGKTLEEHIGRKGMKISEVLRYGAEIADAMAKAHAAGIVHRDLKPSNIIIGEDGHVKVVDFGLAKLVEQTEADELGPTRTISSGDGDLTEHGTIVGTLAYLSPEQAEGKPVDARSDIFSFGAVLYEMITGEAAFRRPSRAATLSAVLHEEPKPIQELRQDVPVEFAKVVNRCLRKDPDRRLRSMADLALALRELKEESESGALSSPAPQGRRRKPTIAALIAASAILLASVVAIELWRGRPRTLHTPQLTPITTYPGVQMQPSLSPDGSQVAFSWKPDSKEKFNIYVKAIGQGPPLRLTSENADDTNPAWSPDGSSIAFLRNIGAGHFKVFLIPALGGTARASTEIEIPDFDWISGSLLAWFPDSQSLVFADAIPGRRTTALWTFSLTTGERRRLTSPPPGSIGDGAVAVSPDGGTVAFCRQGPLGEWTLDVFAVGIGSDLRPTGPERRVRNLSAGLMWFSGLAWTPSGAALVLSFEHGMYRLPVAYGRESDAVRIEGLDHSNWPAFARRASRFACDRQVGGDHDIWRLPLTTAGDKAGEPARFIASTRLEFAQTYSPDGRHIAFESDRGGNLEIWTCDSEGANCSQLTFLHSLYTGIPTWSPDSRRIAFYSRAGDKVHIYVVGADGGPAHRITQEDADEFYPRWSRDGEWIYFASKRTGSYQVWKVRPTGGEPVQVTLGGGFAASDSLDGRWIYFTRSESLDSGLWRIPSAGGQEAEVLPAIVAHNYQVVEKGIYSIAQSPQGLAIQFTDLDGRSRRVISPVRPGYVGFSVSPDRRWITYTETNPQTSELLMTDDVTFAAGR